MSRAAHLDCEAGRHSRGEDQFLRLLELVEQGESVVIARHGKPVARLVRTRQNAGLRLGIAKDAPLASSGDNWWQPLTDSEVEDWTEGR